jgi:hypothetical protein
MGFHPTIETVGFSPNTVIKSELEQDVLYNVGNK